MLVHAAAGGVGQLLVQLAVSQGARVLALASTPEKTAVASAAGAHATATYADDWVAAAQGFGAGGVDVAYDSVGSTLGDSLRAVRIGGAVVFFGMAGGNPAPVDPRALMDGSRTLTVATYGTCCVRLPTGGGVPRNCSHAYTRVN